MAENVFGFLLELDEDKAKDWLRRYVCGEQVEPAVRVPFDMTPVAFLLGEVGSMIDLPLPLRIGTLAGSLLAEQIRDGAHRRAGAEEMEALFALVESLPVSNEIVEFLHDLAVAGRLLPPSEGGGTDLHLLALRTLVFHQRPRPGQIDRMVAFWTRELEDPRYAPIAIQGLLELSVREAIQALPAFVRLARASRPPIPLANTLFVVSEALGTDNALWRELVRVFEGAVDEFEIVRETFGRSRLPESNPAAWRVLCDAGGQASGFVAFTPRYVAADDQAVKRARAGLGEAGLLAPVAMAA